MLKDCSDIFHIVQIFHIVSDASFNSCTLNNYRGFYHPPPPRHTYLTVIRNQAYANTYICHAMIPHVNHRGGGSLGGGGGGGGLPLLRGINAPYAQPILISDWDLFRPIFFEIY